VLLCFLLPGFDAKTSPHFPIRERREGFSNDDATLQAFIIHNLVLAHETCSVSP
jgi:hypothetical protein